MKGARKSRRLGSCCNLRDTWEGRLADSSEERRQDDKGGDEQEREKGAGDVIGEAEKEVGKGRGFHIVRLVSCGMVCLHGRE